MGSSISGNGIEVELPDRFWLMKISSEEGEATGIIYLSSERAAPCVEATGVQLLVVNRKLNSLGVKGLYKCCAALIDWQLN